MLFFFVILTVSQQRDLLGVQNAHLPEGQISQREAALAHPAQIGHEHAPRGHHAADLVVAPLADGDEAFAAYLEKLAAEHDIHAAEANLYLYLRFLECTYRTYQEKGIDDSIFFDTMKSLSWISEKCFNESGIYGIPQVTYRAWYRRHVNATIFRIDRLEFEIIGSLYDFDLNGHHINKGDTCIYVHIPGGSPLDFQECENAYDKAREFFHKGFGFDPVIFYCGSWLLHPWLVEDFPDSRIAKFQKQFQLADIVQDEPVIRSWIFNKSDAPYDELPIKTSLHKAAAHRLKNGLSIGYARGYRF